MAYAINIGTVTCYYYYVDRLTGNLTKSAQGSAPSFHEDGAKTLTTKRVKPGVLQRNWTDFNGTITQYTQSSVKGWSGSTSAGEWWWTGLYSNMCDHSLSSTPTIPTSELGAVCDGKLRAKIKNSNLNLAQALAEYRQTSKMLVDLTTDVLKTFRAIRRGRTVEDIVRRLKSPKSRNDQIIANRWLQYQYGLKPLMSDIYGSAEALAVKIRDGFPMYVSASTERSTSGLYKGSSGQWSAGWTEVGKCQKRCRYTIRDSTLKQLSQLGITNPALLVWELIPYSFVFDWIVPVGKWLESLDALNGVEDIVVNTRYFRLKEVKNDSYHGFTKSTQRYAGQTFIGFPKLAYKASESLIAVSNGIALLSQLRKH